MDTSAAAISQGPMTAHALPFWVKLTLGLGGLAILALVLAIVALCIWMYKVNKDVRDLSDKLKQSLVLLRCYLLIYLWRVRFQAKKAVPWIVLVLFTVAGFVTVSELVARIFHAPALRFSELLETALSHLWVQIPLLCVELLVIRHHLREHRKRDQESTMCAVLSELLGPLNDVNQSVAATTTTAAARLQAHRQFEEQLCQAFVRLFRERGISKVDLAIMRWDDTRKKLTIEFPYAQPTTIDLTLELGEGEGAAGTSYARNSMMYVPAIGYKHGIEVLSDRLEVLPSVYVKSKQEPFESILCIPFHDATKSSRGVLNLTSTTKGAFSPSEFRMGTLAATILSLMD